MNKNFSLNYKLSTNTQYIYLLNLLKLDVCRLTYFFFNSFNKIKWCSKSSLCCFLRTYKMTPVKKIIVATITTVAIIINVGIRKT